MSRRPEDLLRELPAQFQFRPRPFTDPIDMEFLISHIDDAQLRNRLIAVRLETAAKVLHTMAEGAQAAAGIMKG